MPVEEFECVDSKEERGATFGRWAAKSLFSPSCAGPGLRTSRPRVPTPPGPWRRSMKEVELECELSVRREREKSLGSMLGRGRSRDREGVERGEKVRDFRRGPARAGGGPPRGPQVRDFRRLRGKKPRLRRERRAISMGWGKLWRETQEEWV